jgi:hypothetical protein
VGPAGGVLDNQFAMFDGPTGKVIKGTGLTLDTDGDLAANSNTRIPSQNAVRAYVAANGGASSTLAAGDGLVLSGPVPSPVGVFTMALSTTVRPRVIRRTTDLGKTTSALGADPVLSMAVDLGITYRFWFYLITNSLVAARLKFQLYGPSGSTAAYTMLGPPNVVSGGTTSVFEHFPRTLASQVVLGGATSLDVTAILTGIFTPDNLTSGVFGLNWAQNAANATPSILRAGSTLVMEQLQ